MCKKCRILSNDRAKGKTREFVKDCAKKSKIPSTIEQNSMDFVSSVMYKTRILTNDDGIESWI